MAAGRLHNLLIPHLEDYCMDAINCQSPRGMSQEVFCPWNPLYALLPLLAVGSDLVDDSLIANLTTFLSHRGCQGGFSGFPQDNLHVVTGYAAISAIACLGTEAAYSLIDRPALYDTLISFKLPSGAFRTSRDQESDIRSTYCALLIAYMTNMLTPEITRNCREFFRSCCNYDGGYSPNPGVESHGGFVHCAVGGLKILGHLNDLDFDRLIPWIALRQMSFGGGFCGRPHKLIDTCYSWWIGSAARIICDHLNIPPFWDESAVATFLLEMAQDRDGGMTANPPINRDPFHTLYGIAGLAVCGGRETRLEDGMKLEEMDTLIPCPKERAEKMRAWFAERPFNPCDETFA
jgi:protein farnesyltransferase subunit beta